MSDRQLDLEYGAAVLGIFDTDIAAHGSGALPDDPEAEPEAGGGPAGHGAREPFEDSIPMFSRDAEGETQCRAYGPRVYAIHAR